MELFFIDIIDVLERVDGPYLMTPPSVNDKAAFHTHWAELCESSLQRKHNKAWRPENRRTGV